ncbi:hypothetical protein C8R45DRAFT_568786 [Mycena sanguinolenta]|nr:hypothetical protein C8R45DRAFT_568786 [Mycena sanguinolenta]
MGASLNCEFHGDVAMHNAYHRGESGIQILHHSVALAAIHNSVESYPQPRCHPETRTRMLDDLWLRSLDSNPETTILWLYGPAGAGKSAIMQTLAGQLHDAGRLGGCFFFKRGDAMRGNGKTVFTTIAYQLALNVPWLRTPISDVVENNPSVLALSIDTQMQKLLSEPCYPYGGCKPLAIIIDGLDECNGHDVQAEILRAIRNLASHYTTPFRFFVASRPEPHIREVFESTFYSSHYHSVNVEQSFDDVRTYLRDEFARIHREHSTMAKIPLPWPSSDVLKNLVEKSSGHFIYPSTIIKFIDDKSYRPVQRLALVLDGSSMGYGSTFHALDQLYLTVLSSAPRQDEFMPILCILVEEGAQAISTFDELLGLEEGESKLLLRGLYSLIKRYTDPFGECSCEERIVAHHASFLDFLSEASRAQKFHVGRLQNRMLLARGFLRSTSGEYRTMYFDYEPSPSQRILNRELIPLMISLPPSMDLCPLIGRMNPEYILNLKSADLDCMLSWLNRIPSASRDLIKLWEDYVFMASFQEINGTVQVETHSTISPESEHVVSPSHEILQVIVTMVFLGTPLWRVPTLLDITWDKLRATICSIRPIMARYEPEPPLQVLLRLVPREVYSRASRDLALQLIPRMQKDLSPPQTSTDVYAVWERFPLLVRFSAPCPQLYRELWSIPFPRAYWLSIADMIIHHVSKWLEPFVQPRIELVAFWRNCRTPQNDAEPGRTSEWVAMLHQSWEEDWRKHVDRWNSTIKRMKLPVDLEFPL